MHDSGTIHPINHQQRAHVEILTIRYLRQAATHYGYDYQPVQIAFDLKGRAAGVYQVRQGRVCIRYNPYIFAKFFEDNLATTIPHEVAHYVSDRLFGLRNIKPHGKEWQGIMQDFGIKPEATGRYDLTGIPVRRQKRHEYHCICRTHQISSSRHNKIQQGSVSYQCQYCGSTISFSGEK